MTNAPSPTHDTVAQLKNDIDTGRTGDKVAAGDPGLSPLGTDDEAAGRPASPEVVRQARQQEAAIGAAAAREDPGTKSGTASILIMVAVVAVIAIVAVAFFVLRR